MKSRIFSIVIFFILTSSFCFAQKKPCLLDIKDSPTLRGIRLGMKRSDIEILVNTPLKLESETTVVHLEKKLTYLLNDKDVAAKKVLNYYKNTDSERTYSGDGHSHAFVPVESYFASLKYLLGKKAPENFKDIDHLFLNFYEDKVYSILINYKTDMYDDYDHKEFVSEMLGLLGMPKDISGIGPLSIYPCKDFLLSVGKLNGEVEISLEDESTRSFLHQRAIQILEETYKRFKREKQNGTGFKP